MRLLLASVLVLVAATIVSAHVEAIYNGMNLKIRAATGTGDEPQSTAGPCGGAETFGSNGVNSLQVGDVINLQLQYAQNHRIPGGNYFYVGMICTTGDPSTLGNDNPLRLSQAANQVNKVQISPVNVPDERLITMPLVLPQTSPAGVKLASGTYCTVSIMDERDWGGCVDIKIQSNPGPIIAGVVTPVALVGAGAAVFFANRRYKPSFSPAAGAANPDRLMWRSMTYTFFLMIMSILACAVPAWNQSNGFYFGPWLYCPRNTPSSTSCTSSTVTGFTAIYAVRFFVMSATVAIILAFFAPILVFYQRLDAVHAATFQFGAFTYAIVAHFVAFMVWISMFGMSTTGWALYFNLVTCLFGMICVYIALTWKAHAVAAPTQTPVSVVTNAPSAVSAPIEKSPKPVTTMSPAKSYPTSSAAANANANAAKYASPSGAVTQPLKEATYPKKFRDWEEIWDEENQAYYFFNHSNGESVWERPAGWPQL